MSSNTQKRFPYLGCAIILIMAMFAYGVIRFGFSFIENNTSRFFVSVATLIALFIFAFRKQRTVTSELPANTQVAETATSRSLQAGNYPWGDDAAPVKKLVRLLGISENPLGALSDICKNSKGEFGPLPEVLTRALPRGFAHLNAINLRPLSANRRWWILEDQPDDARRNDCLALEGALNLATDLLREHDEKDTRSLDEKIEAAFKKAPFIIPYTDKANLSPSMSMYLGGETGGEWDVRYRIALGMECMPQLFRLSYFYQVSVEERLCTMNVRIMPVSAFAIARPDDVDAQARTALNYAYDVSLAIANMMFSIEQGPRRALITMRDADEAYLSLDCTSDNIAELLASRTPERPVDAPLPQVAGLRAATPEQGSFVAITSWEEEREQPLIPTSWREPISEFDPEPVSAAVTNACDVLTRGQLAINPDAQVIKAWNSIVTSLGETTESAVSTLVALRDGSADQRVRSSSERVIAALVDGLVDADGRKEMAELFMSSDHKDSLHHASELLQAEDPAAVEQAIQLLLDALATYGEHPFADTDTIIWRSFETAAERIQARRMFPDRTNREVRLVPREYIQLIRMLSGVYLNIEEAQKAVPYLDELVRFSPTNVDIALRRVRALEDADQVFEAAHQLETTLRTSCLTRNDYAVCLYRYAYMQWKLSNLELVAACYLHAAEMSPQVRADATKELEELCENEPELARFAKTVDPAEVLLRAELLGLDFNETFDYFRTAMIALIDAKLFEAGDSMADVVRELLPSDAAHSALKSLTS